MLQCCQVVGANYVCTIDHFCDVLPFKRAYFYYKMYGHNSSIIY